MAKSESVGNPSRFHVSSDWTLSGKGKGVYLSDYGHAAPVTFENTYAFPRLFPIPQLDSHVIATRDHKGLCRMYSNSADI